jgi:hypothetical protein
MPKFNEPIHIDFAPDVDEPEGGWEKACTVEDHSWEMELEEGAAILHPTDPCSDEKIAAMGPYAWPVCRERYWDQLDIVMHERIPVKVTHVDDSSPAGPWGPAEYGFYIKVKPC